MFPQNLVSILSKTRQKVLKVAISWAKDEQSWLMRVDERLMNEWWMTDEWLMNDWWMTDEQLMNGWFKRCGYIKKRCGYIGFGDIRCGYIKKRCGYIHTYPHLF